MFPHTSLSQCHAFEMSYYAVSGVIVLEAGRDKKYHAENKYLFSVISLPCAAVLQGYLRVVWMCSRYIL